MKSYQPIIGLEVHVELCTKSKMFCGCPADHFGQEPNTRTCPVCLGLPGALPVPNRKAIEWTILLGLALECEINPESHFDRKNYFYPDLPKSYQITQYEKPLAENGKLKISPGRQIRIRRVHLEEDTGKLQHTQIDGEKVALVDFNRSGVPLVEIVTEPDFRSIEEVDLYIKKLQRIIRYLEISNADMEKGSMRLEPSISLLGAEKAKALPFPLPQNLLPKYRVELKNINSFRFARKALEYEIDRQTKILESDEKVVQQTRGWSEDRASTFAQREKEEEHDYRYFPEPDIPPLKFSQEETDRIKAALPELPDAKSARFVKDYNLSEYQAELLSGARDLADYFEKAVEAGSKQNVSPVQIANWLINKKIDIGAVSVETLTGNIAEAKEIVAVSEQELEETITKVLSENQKAVQDFKKGKTGVLGFLIGETVRKLGPKTDRQIVVKKLQEKLSN